MIPGLILAAAAATAAPAPNDYALGQNWLCRPDRRDACSTANLDISEIAANGAVTVRASQRAAAPKADCFYVYPTLSYDETGNSDMVANDEERRVVEVQFARFREQCRTFAPIYRSVTLTALRAAMTGKPMAADRELNYADVRDAWRHYLKADNQGRPYVLVGHSQGSGLLKRLIAEEIDGKPTQKQLLSAMLAGTNVLVPTAKDVGGDFKATPLCRKNDQTGCVLAWVTFRDAVPPPADARFGMTDKPGMQVACTNPAGLRGGPVPLNAVLPKTNIAGDMSTGNAPWTSDAKPLTTNHIALPSLYSGQCVSNAGANYLSVKLSAGTAGGRIADPGGDVRVGPVILKDWGLHLLDVNIVMQNMVDLVPQQLAAWEKTKQ